jgi:hypothetical protein
MIQTTSEWLSEWGNYFYSIKTIYTASYTAGFQRALSMQTMLGSNNIPSRHE